METTRQPGTYILVIELSERAQIAVGSLGSLCFEQGYYLYVGSALGGLGGRLRRHLAAVKRPHWHIDHLLARGRIVEIWYAEGNVRLECAWAEALRRWSGTAAFGARFGASDCPCFTHLFYAREQPSLALVNEQSGIKPAPKRWGSGDLDAVSRI